MEGVFVVVVVDDVEEVRWWRKDERIGYVEW